MNDDSKKIEERIESAPELEEFRAELEYDWPNRHEHANWVANAPVEEIVDWAETIRNQ